MDGVFDHEEPAVDKHLYLKITNTILKDKTVMLRTKNDLILKLVDGILVFEKDKIISVDSHNEYTKKYTVQDKLIQQRIEHFRKHYDEDLKKAGIRVGSKTKLEEYMNNLEQRQDGDVSIDTITDQSNSFFYDNVVEEIDKEEIKIGTITEEWDDK